MDGNIEIITKKCTKCGEVKALSDFFVDKRRKGGKRSACKRCSAVSSRNYYSSNKDSVKELVRTHYVNNRDYKLRYIKQYRILNPHVKLRSDNKRRAMKRNLPHCPLTTWQYERLREFRSLVFGEVTV